VCEYSLDQDTDCVALQHWVAYGEVNCQHGNKCECDFHVEQLLNGRIRVILLLNEEKLGDGTWLNLCSPLSVHGRDEQGRILAVDDVHITHEVLSGKTWPFSRRIGYARTALLQEHREPSGDLVVEFELSSSSLHVQLLPVELPAGDFSVQLERVTWPESRKLVEHGFGYRHPTVFACLRIPGVPSEEEAKVDEFLRRFCLLLSLANRGYVFPVTKRVIAGGNVLRQVLTEPIFTSLGWARPLISPQHLREFLTTAYGPFDEQYENMDLALALDYCLQAMTLRSAWASSLGVFTAMETLKTAFFRQRAQSEGEWEYWVVPPGDFEAKPDVCEELLAVLADRFPRFRVLESRDRASIRGQLVNLNRRSYKTQLRRMLDVLNVEYEATELQPFIDVRNSIIHSGRPSDSEGWKRIEKAASLFERVLLAILGYSGPSAVTGKLIGVV
jgi:hypothetical protein